jgi:hypothetical protein
MAKLDFHSLSLSQSIEWNLVLAQSCLRYNEECLYLGRSLDAFSQNHQEDLAKEKKSAFIASIQTNKNHHKSLFLRFPFPSQVEVTTTSAASLAHYGLSSVSNFAKFVFDEFVFKADGSSASSSIAVQDEVAASTHEFNTPEGREDLWPQLGPSMIKGVGVVRNTLVNLLRDSLSKLRRFLLAFHFFSLSFFFLISSIPPIEAIISREDATFCFLDDKLPKKNS